MDGILNSTVCEGRLELKFKEPFINGWFALCDGSFGPEEIQVACRQLGCDIGNGYRTHILMYVDTVPKNIVGSYIIIMVGTTCTERGRGGCPPHPSLKRLWADLSVTNLYISKMYTFQHVPILSREPL